MSDDEARVYIDDCFAGDDWGKWSGGGHLQADTPEALHAFAARLGLKREWFQSKPGRPDHDHYDLTRSKRELALRLGAVDESLESGALRRKIRRQMQREPVSGFDAVFQWAKDQQFGPDHADRMRREAWGDR